MIRKYFAGHADQFVLIGGTAATLAMKEVGLEFRATTDLDIVLHIEALSPAFGKVAVSCPVANVREHWLLNT